jgi:hypothetical protein
MTNRSASSDFDSKHAADTAEFQRLETRKTEIAEALCASLKLTEAALDTLDPDTLDAPQREALQELRHLTTRTSALRSKMGSRRLSDFLANPEGTEERRWWLNRY